MHVKSFCRLASSYSVVAALPAIIACCVLPLLTSPVPAETLGTAVIGMFPRDMREFAHTDLKATRKFAWFEPMRDALMPKNFQLFNQFVASVGLDPNSQVDGVYWGVVALPDRGEQMVGVAVGRFDPSGIEDRFQEEKLPSFDLHGFSLYAFGTGQGPGDIFFTLLDSDTAAFGGRAALEKLLDVRTGGSERLFVNETLFPVIGQANSSDATLWAVLDHKYALQAMREFVPSAMQFPQTAAITDRLKALTISVDARSDNEIDLSFQMVCGSVDDANTFAAALQVGLMSRRYMAGDDDAITVILDHARVVPSGDRLQLDFSLTQEQVQSFVLSSARPVLNF